MVATPAQAQYSTTTLDVGLETVSIAVNPVTDTIYLGGNDTDAPGAEWNNIIAIDGATNATSSIVAGELPEFLDLNPATNRIYVTGRDATTVVDGATNATITIPNLFPNAGTAVNPVTNKIYLNCGESVTVIDGATNAATSIPTGGGYDPEGIAVNPVTNKIYVGSYNLYDSSIDRFLLVIDGSTNAVTTITRDFTGGFLVDPVTNKIYVSGDDHMSVIDGVTEIASPLNTGPDTYPMALNPVTNKVYAITFNDNNLTVIDGATGSIGTVALGRGDSEYGIAVNPVTNKIYVDNADTGILTVVDGATNATTSVAVPQGPGPIAVNPVTNRTYLLNIYDSTVTVISDTAQAGPAFASGPESLVVNAGAPVILNASAGGASGVTYRWFANGLPLSDGAGISGSSTGMLYLTGSATQADTGTYACVATNGVGSTSSRAAALTVVNTPTPGRLINLSCRSLVGTGANVMIAGFVVGGAGTSGSQSLLLRASGPALVPFGVDGVLPDPDLEILNSGSTVPFSANAGWGGDALASSAASAVGAFPWADPQSLDSALVQSLPAGPYTSIVYGASGDSGVALAEIFDATPPGSYSPATPRLTNISARAMVGQGDNVQIAGFIIGGTTSETVLIRASGPALAPLGVSGALADPQLQLKNADGVVASNTGWGGNAQIAAASAAVGAFPWGASPTPDSAILITLPPGAYTAEVSGASGDTGVALVEVYEVR